MEVLGGIGKVGQVDPAVGIAAETADHEVREVRAEEGAVGVGKIRVSGRVVDTCAGVTACVIIIRRGNQGGI